MAAFRATDEKQMDGMLAPDQGCRSKDAEECFHTTNLLGRLFFDLFLCYIVANSTTAFAGMRFHASDFAQELFYEILLIFISEKVNN